MTRITENPVITLTSPGSSSNHFHWIFWFYEQENSDGTFNNNTVIDLVADDYVSAKKKLEAMLPLNLKHKKGLKNSGYNLREVIEHLPGACVGGHR